MVAQLDTNRKQTLAAHRVLAHQLHDQHAFAPGQTVEEATDIVYALVSLELYCS